MEIQDFENYSLYVVFNSTDYREINDFKHGYAACTHNNGVCGYIDTKGFETLLFNYDDVGDFCSLIAPVCKNNKWGFINNSFEEVVPCKYVYLRFYNNLFIVKESFNSDFIVINDKLEQIYRNENIDKVLRYLNKKEVINNESSNIIRKEYTIPYSNKKYCVYLNSNGERIIPFTNTEIRNFSCSFVIIKVDSNDFRIFNEKGRQIKPHTCIKINAENMYLKSKIDKFNYIVSSKEASGFSSIIKYGEYEYIVFGATKEELELYKAELIDHINIEVKEKVKK